MIRYTNSTPVVGRILRYIVFGGSLKISKANIVGLQYSACKNNVVGYFHVLSFVRNVTFFFMSATLIFKVKKENYIPPYICLATKCRLKLVCDVL
jgi:hypothetical protein